MRPLNLKLKGFTSFRDEQEIDFTDLDLFVLWGPTGSGKSSLLDAITYALFGRVERVGDEVAQLVSHGQPRLAVSLEFAVGEDRYLVTRSKSPKGHSTALLQRAEGDEWVSHDEGADQVREVNKMITALIGLDYDAFARSVILPQGKFAEFLTGDAAKRREILTELLGLELFKRMSQRANEISKDAKVHFDTKTQLLEREYAGIDSDALQKAQDEHATKVGLLDAAQELEKNLEVIEKKWLSAEAARKSLANCIAEVRDAAETFDEAADDLDRHARTSAEAEAAVKEARAAAKDAKTVLSAISKKRATAEGRWGSLEDLAGLRSKVDAIEDARADHEDAIAALAEVEAEISESESALKEAAAVRDATKKDATAATKALADAERAHEDAHRKEAVGALVEGLKPGDPCPICDRPLDKLPKAARKEIEAARKVMEDSRSAAAAAEAARVAAATSYALAEQNVAGAKKSLQRLKKDVTNRKGRLDVLTAEVSTALGKGEPVDQIEKRTAELRALMEEEAEATTVENEARRELERRELALSKLGSEIERVRTRMTSIPLAPMCARVADAAPEVEAIDALPGELPTEPDRLAVLASSTSKELTRLAEELEGLQATRDRELERLVAEARDALPGGSSLDVTNITSVVAHARATASQLKSDAALTAENVKKLEERLETKARYEEEIETHRSEHEVYRALGKELRSDSIVQYLQAEALVALAHAASAHLEELSSTRYRLSYEDDRFFVVDAWNGDERRNVKTLSGGETFQASLALALALSEQVQFLAVTERNRLDSLFLDEGFGTLDAETLEVVVGAIEQLGGDDRLVGVITHVPELADRLPVRIEVAKSPRGSTLKRAGHELTPLT